MAWTALAAGRLGDAQAAARKRRCDHGLFRADRLAAGGTGGRSGKATPRRFATSSTSLLAEPSRGSALMRRHPHDPGRSRGAGRPNRERRLPPIARRLRAWQGLGLAWDEALCAIDMVTVLDPADPEVRAAADAARTILTRLGAKPMLERLDAAISRSAKGAPGEAGSANGEAGSARGSVDPTVASRL